MSTNTLNVRIQEKYDTEANWIAKNPVLLKGEVAYSSDKNNAYKVGDGTSTWSGLTYTKGFGKVKVGEVTIESGQNNDTLTMAGGSNITITSNTETNTVTVATSAQANVIEKVKVNNTALTPDANKAVDITMTGATVKATGYSKPTSSSAIVTTDTMNGALGKLEYKADDLATKKANKTSVSTDSTAVSVKTVPETLGYAGVKVIGGKTVKSKNILDAKSIYNSSDFTWDGDIVSGTAATFNSIRIQVTSSMVGKTYTFSAELKKTKSTDIFVCFRKEDGTSISGNIIESSSEFEKSCVTVTPTSTNDFFFISYGSGGGYTMYAKNIQLEEGSTATAYEPYGELYSAPVERIVSKGANLIEKTINSSSISSNTGGIISDSAYCMNIVKVKANQKYTINKGNDDVVYGFYKQMPYIGSISYNNTRTVVSGYTGINNYTLTAEIDGYLAFRTRLAYTNASCALGETPTSATPYFETELSLPNCVKNLPDYGVGISADCTNYVDFEQMKYYRNCGVVDLGSLTWYYTSSGSGVAPFFNASIPNAKYYGKFDVYEYPYLCSKYPLVLRTTSDFVDKSMSLDGNATNVANQIEIKDSTYDNLKAFKTGMNGVKFVYELETPEVYDISSILAPIPCETGGTITLVNEHSLDVPNTIVYKTSI